MQCRKCGLVGGPCRIARIRARNRRKRCYELAGRGICESDCAESLLLVHGVVRDPQVGAYDHAWLLDPKTSCVYDPVIDRCFTAAEYEKQMFARAERTYTYMEVCKITVVCGAACVDRLHARLEGRWRASGDIMSDHVNVPEERDRVRPGYVCGGDCNPEAALPQRS